MSLANFSIKQPVLVNLLTVLIILSGLFIYVFEMRKELFPDFEVNYIAIMTLDPGTGAEAVEQNLTVPIENEVSAVDGIASIDSVSTDSRSVITVELETDTDIDQALLDLKAQADLADLPDCVEPPIVTKFDLGLPVISFGLYGDADALGLTPLELEKKLTELAKQVEDALRLVDGVDDVTLVGIRDREIAIETTPERLAQYDLSLEEIARAITAADTHRASGTLRGTRRELILQTGAELGADTGVVRDLSRVIVRSGIPLEEVATVHDGFTERITGTRLWVPRDEGNASDRSLVCVQVQVGKRSKADTIRVADRLREFAAQYQKQLPEGYRLEVFNDFSIYIRNRVANVETNGMIGLVVVLVVLFVFLNYRMAFMTALGIPLSLLGAVTIMHVLGYSANLLSLFGLIVAIGLVVDDAIIICENAYRHIERGLSPPAAVVKGTREVFWPLIGAVLTTIAAFLPLLMWQGITGKYMSVIPIGVCIALAVSLVEALIILPSHIAEWSQRFDAQGRPLPATTRVGRTLDVMFRFAEPFRLGFARLLARFRNFYTFVLARCLRWRYVVLFLVFVLFMFSIGVAVVYMKKTFVETKEIDRFTVKVELARGTTLDTTSEQLAVVEELVREIVPREALASVQVTVGRKFGATRNIIERGNNVGMIDIEILSPGDYRLLYDKPSPTNYKRVEIVEGWISEIRGRITAKLPTARTEVVSQHGGPPTGRPVEIRLRGEDPDRLLDLAAGLEEFLATVPGVTDIANDVEVGTQELHLEINGELAAQHGLDDASVARYVSAAFDGLTAAVVKDDQDEIDIVVRLDERRRRDRAAVMQTELTAPDGERLVLASLVQLHEQPGYAFIKRYDQKRTVTVFANVQGITAVEANARAASYLDFVLTETPGYSARYGGEFEDQQESMVALLRAMMLALFLIYLILATVLRSFVQPLLIMAAVPLGLIGVFFGLNALGESLSVISMIGMVALTGIVVNDSTVLVAFINRSRREGASRWLAILRAGKIRLRPILLTTITTVGGMFTLSFGHLLGIEGQETFLAPMGIAVVFGLTFATGLTLIVVPCLYAVYEDVLALLGIDVAAGARRQREIDAIVDAANREELEAAVAVVASADRAAAPSESGGSPPGALGGDGAGEPTSGS